MLIPKEEQEQIALMDWINLHKLPEFIHIPNGGSRHPAEARKLKRMGVKSGVSDFLFARPLHGYAGLWIELKRNDKNAKPTKEQAEWLSLMTNNGYKAVVCRGAEEAIKEISSYLSGK